MKAAYYIELLSRSGEVQHRHGVSGLPIRLGRGYDNDFILDDVHTAAHHALVELDADGQLCITDLGSRNGLVFQGKRQTHLLINGNSVVRLGQTNLRIRSADFQVEQEAFDTNNYAWEGMPPAIAGLVLICLLGVFGTWLADTEKFGLVRYLIALAPLFATGLVWSGMWAFANRLFGGHARFGRHLFIAACGLMLAELWSFASSLAGFAFSLEVLTRYSSHIFVAICAATLYFHLTTIKPRHPRRLLVTVTLLAMLGSGLVLMMNYQRHGRLADEAYMTEMFSPSLRLSQDHSVDQFMAGAEKLKATVERERKKGVEHGAVGGDEDE
ncbi:FHA domain-containing protein [Undibacterium piscinae]|uniref:FHA domain-containing protein n=1 Tax=Undibacterium piscinae TaxID=2495591 RepID=A0A6M4A5Q4_9BURK|nr:FHA domain-containing protein [Undibacterium piscinae]